MFIVFYQRGNTKIQAATFESIAEAQLSANTLQHCGFTVLRIEG